MTDEELADAWEACALDRAISHEEHVRIARVLGGGFEPFASRHPELLRSDLLGRPVWRAALP